MQAITTKYLPPTNTRDSRIKATSGNGDNTLTVGWDHECDVTENHKRAANALAKRLGWDGVWVGGETQSGYVYCYAGRPGKCSVSCVDHFAVLTAPVAATAE